MKHTTFEKSRDYKKDIAEWGYLHPNRKHQKMLNRHKAKNKR